MSTVFSPTNLHNDRRFHAFQQKFSRNVSRLGTEKLQPISHNITNTVLMGLAVPIIHVRNLPSGEREFAVGRE